VRIKIITPIIVPEEERSWREERYRKLFGPSHTIDIINLPEGPRAFEGYDDLLWSELSVYREACNQDPADFDAMMVDCVFDTAVARLRMTTAMPVFGPLEETLRLLRALNRKFVLLSRSQKISQWLTQKVLEYGYKDLLDTSVSMNLSVSEFAEIPKREEAIFRAIENLRLQYENRVVVMGCTAIAGTDRPEWRTLSASVLFPGEVALRSLAFYDDLGLLTS